MHPLEPHQIIPLDQLPNRDISYLDRLVVLKVNGGLGTSMGKYSWHRWIFDNKACLQGWTGQKVLSRSRTISRFWIWSFNKSNIWTQSIIRMFLCYWWPHSTLRKTHYASLRNMPTDKWRLRLSTNHDTLGYWKNPCFHLLEAPKKGNLHGIRLAMEICTTHFTVLGSLIDSYLKENNTYSYRTLTTLEQCEWSRNIHEYLKCHSCCFKCRTENSSLYGGKEHRVYHGGHW